ncbi:hypothetical protein RIF29_33887 [Crotalaria pallida]|uniref:Uncharacterized protein n=1 Tax=Crotalaria pallida TaxID=3830 RepID=A0AAN9E8L1_CROPI
MDSYLHAFVPANGYSNDYRRVFLVPLQSPLFYRNGHHHFFSSSNTTIGEIYLSQSFQHANDFHRAMQVDLWIYSMISTIGPQTVSATLDYLLTDDTLRIEESIIVDYGSFIFHIIEVRPNQQLLVDNISNEGVILIEEEDEVSNMGLSEDRVMMHIGHGNFEFVEEETIDNKEACCICQVRMDIS